MDGTLRASAWNTAGVRAAAAASTLRRDEEWRAPDVSMGALSIKRVSAPVKILDLTGARRSGSLAPWLASWDNSALWPWRPRR